MLLLSCLNRLYNYCYITSYIKIPNIKPSFYSFSLFSSYFSYLDLAKGCDVISYDYIHINFKVR